MTTEKNEFLSIEKGHLRLHLHPGQRRAWHSSRRFVVVLAGTQGGKTAFGPHWLFREIQRRGAGDYMVVTPTFPLLEMKALPEFRRLFEDILKLGHYIGSPVRKFVFSPEGARRAYGNTDLTNIFFGYAADPDSLESATAKAAWLDEAGQKKFKLASWEAIQRRLSIHQGRVLITTTPYNLGWLKQKLWDEWRKGDKDIEVVRFESRDNPAFPEEEFERARRTLPRWKFDMFYRGVFTRPAGLIYDNFSEAHKCPRFAVPRDWKRYIGLDFGGVNTAAMFYAEEPGTGRLYAYREYKAGGRTAAQHAAKILEGEPFPALVVGGSKSEGQWRQEFRAAGLPVRGPDQSEVEVGIDRVYGAHANDSIIVFDDLYGYLDEKMSYSRALDVNGDPTEQIEDKHSYHFMDAERYIISYLNRVDSGWTRWAKEQLNAA